MSRDRMDDGESDFVKNIEEESNEDENDNRMNNMIKNRKAQSSGRPESKHGRNSGKPNSKAEEYDNHSLEREEEDDNRYNHYDQHNEEDEESFDNPILSKFNRYISYHSINIEDFWTSKKVFIKPEEFKQYLNTINFIVTGDEFEILVKEFIVSKDNKDIDGKERYITIENLCKNVEAWRNNADYMIEFIKENALKIAQESKKKLTSARNKNSSSVGPSNRPYSSQPFYQGGGRPISGISNKSKASALTTDMKLSNLAQSQKPIENRSKQYLKKAKEKDQEIERILALTIKRSKNEFEYECLIKMGEANELSQQLQSKITYRAYKSADGSLKVHVYEVEKFVKELTLDEFQREYNIIKTQYNQSKKLKIWQVLNETKKGKNQSNEVIKKEEPKNTNPVNKKDKQLELKQVLLETMMLTNILKEQLAVLTKNKLNGGLQNQTINQNKTNTFNNTQNTITH